MYYMEKDKITFSDKEKKLILNFTRAIYEFLSGKDYIPLRYNQLISRLKITKEVRPLFYEAVTSLIKDDRIMRRKSCYVVAEKHDTIVEGTLSVHPRGFAFLQPNDTDRHPQDIFVPASLTKHAVDGDIVEVQVLREASKKGPEGKVISIIKRTRSHVAGTITKISHNKAYAYVPLLGEKKDIVVHLNDTLPLHTGDRAIMKVIKWGESEIICEPSHLLGNISDASCDVAAAMEEFNIDDDFPHDVLEEVAIFKKRVPLSEIDNREDLRELESFTIDPDTAKDFDDALSLRQDSNGSYHLSVHIADVAHYVQPGTALDREARKRSNSTYFPGYCVPMLPHKLSENLCSLKPNTNRLAISVIMTFNKNGDLTDYRIARSIIRSQRRFTYAEVTKILAGETKCKYAPKLHLMAKLCGLLKNKRAQRGCIEFALPEERIMLNSKGVPTSIEFLEYDISHQLVEEFMIKANEVIATHLSSLGKDLAYRIHDKPNDFDAFAQKASTFGYKVSSPPTSEELQYIFDDARQHAHGGYLAVAFIKSMKLACYSQTNIGHYGLSLDYYCHFTSPIRRYADLTIHRQLFDEHEDEDLRSVTSMCSEQERRSGQAENAVKVLKKLRYISKIREKDPHHHYDARVTTVKPFGFFFELEAPMIEGFIRISDIGDDYFRYSEQTSCLQGSRSGVRYSSGDRITVVLKDLDLIKLDASWELVPAKGAIAKTSPKKKRFKKRRKRSDKNIS
jgi:ribonuclease R